MRRYTHRSRSGCCGHTEAAPSRAEVPRAERPTWLCRGGSGAEGRNTPPVSENDGSEAAGAGPGEAGAGGGEREKRMRCSGLVQFRSRGRSDRRRPGCSVPLAAREKPRQAPFSCRHLLPSPPIRAFLWVYFPWTLLTVGRRGCLVGEGLPGRVRGEIVLDSKGKALMGHVRCKARLTPYGRRPAPRGHA